MLTVLVSVSDANTVAVTLSTSVTVTDFIVLVNGSAKTLNTDYTVSGSGTAIPLPLTIGDVVSVAGKSPLGTVYQANTSWKLQWAL